MLILIIVSACYSANARYTASLDNLSYEFSKNDKNDLAQYLEKLKALGYKLSKEGTIIDLHGNDSGITPEKYLEAHKYYVKKYGNSLSFGGVEFQMLNEWNTLSDKGTVVDIYGFDTGLTEEEYQLFVEEYKKRLEKAPLSPRMGKITLEWALKAKLNLEKVAELIKIDERINSPFDTDMLSRVVCVGKPIRYDKTKGGHIIEIEKIYKGEQFLQSIFGKVPKQIVISLDAGGNYFPEDDELSTSKTKFLFYLGYIDLSDHSGSKLDRLQFRSGGAYHPIWSDGRFGFTDEDTLEKRLNKLKKIMEINDTNNFYKRIKIAKEEKR